MDDLIARANKYAKSAGRTGEGQYRAAEQDERFSRGLSWTSTVLTAIVGTSIFAKWIEDYPLPFGLAAIVAAALNAVLATSKLDQRAEAHRTAGAEYGRFRRRADMLRLRLEGGDLTREMGLAELDRIGEDLSDLATKSRALPDRMYAPAADTFDKTHREYATIDPTHAGGVVVRRDGDIVQYLVVESSTARGAWVLPSGPVELSESAEQAARRSVLQETGIETAVRDALDTIALPPGRRVNATFYLCDVVSERATARRGTDWLDFDRAMERVRVEAFQRLLCHAQALTWRAARAPAATSSQAGV